MTYCYTPIQDADVSLFETNIRFMGGLLAAYALTGDELYKTKAYELGKKLLPAFDSPSGIPYGRINLLTGVCTFILCETRNSN